MSEKTKIISEKTILRADHFTVQQTVLDIVGRGKVTRLDVIRKPTVAIFPLTENNEIYLIREYRYLYKKHIFGAVAGFLEEGELPLECAKRELKEEAGLTAREWQELASTDMARSVIKATVHLFLAKDLSVGESALESDEEIEVKKVPIEEAVERVLTGEIRSAASIMGILMVNELKREGKL